MTAITDRAGKVYLVGAGPGDPELLTMKAAALLRQADVVLHDDLVPSPIVALAGPQAILVNVGKRCGTKKITQLEINQLMIESVRRGMSVVRLKSGDPAIFGRLGEEIDALAAVGIPFEIVPGVTAAVAAVASVGASLTDRRKSSRILIVSGHHASERDEANAGRPVDKIDWRTLVRNGTTIAIYMPGHEFAALRRELLEAGLYPQTPAVVVSRASTPEQRHAGTTLASLHTLAQLPAPTILLIGNSLERVDRPIHLTAPGATADGADSAALVRLAELEAAQGASGRNRERRINP
jgi:uroporphyrin-III C-methyltransferase